ncbi:MAG: alanine--tRNA ligase [Oscillospiraceae bacterium]|nr:alanine--tRNA ligase [Oscillospiraceae bacterium]
MFITSREIRKKFIDFFKSKNHLQIKNSSIIPKNDPTLLFINSGMAAIKNFFTGEEIPPSKQLCNVQSCVRTIDIDDIGDARHLTSFYMLGSWSIGSYFKSTAIKLAFEFLNKCLNIPKEKLYVSVFSGDSELGLPFDKEAKEKWIETGIDEHRIIALGKKDNFWGPASKTGPCGPCTEVFFDTGVGQKYHGQEFDSSRYIEIWNAGVFMMLSKNADSTFSNLAFKSVDTGAGLERLAMTLNGHKSVYETDLILPIKNFIAKLLDIDSKNYEYELRILTDHFKTINLILSEKVSPSNEGRGYIPRKLIRRCIVIIKKICNSNLSCLEEIIYFIIGNLEDINSNFLENKDFIIEKFREEKERFESVLINGSPKLNELKKTKKITGEAAFDLVSTFGLPFDIIKYYSIQNNLKLDEAKYLELLENHKNISRNKTSELITEKIWDKTCDLPETKLDLYENLNINTKILKIFHSNGNEIEKVSNNSQCFMILEHTCAYAKSGGQESDYAYITCGNENLAEVSYVIKKNGIFAHFCTIKNGKFSNKDIINIKIDLKRRKKISRAHSATHLVHAALKQVLGNQVRQQGSKVEENKFHFDFNFDGSIIRKNLFEIERIVNKNIAKNIPCKISEIPLSEAISGGAVALFGEKYGDIVRVVKFGDISKELCGGTHVKMTGEIGNFVIISCTSIGKGLKRIFVLLENDAFEYIQEKFKTLESASKILGSTTENFLKILEKKITLGDKKEEKNKKIDELELKYINSRIKLAWYEYNGDLSNKSMQKIAQKISGAVVFISGNEKKRVTLTISDNINLQANKILALALGKFGGKAGGNEKIASGGVSGVESEEIVESISFLLGPVSNI